MGWSSIVRQFMREGQLGAVDYVGQHLAFAVEGEGYFIGGVVGLI